jgi:hypothetical protein
MANRFKNAAPSEEVEGTFFQIKCEVCGFKDATTDKTTWKCPECEIGIKKVMVVSAPKTTIEKLNKQEKDVQASQQAVNETKAIQHAAETAVETDQFLKDFHNVLGTKPAIPATVKEIFSKGGFQCKIVTTRKN